MAVGGGRRRRRKHRMRGRRGGGVGRAGKVMILVSGGEGRGMALGVKALKHWRRAEGGGARRSVFLPKTLLLFLFFFLCKPLPVVHLQTA